jgi:hypothetical protein
LWPVRAASLVNVHVVNALEDTMAGVIGAPRESPFHRADAFVVLQLIGKYVVSIWVPVALSNLSRSCIGLKKIKK